MIDELAATLAAIRRALDAVGAVWAVGGSLASAAYGEPRATNVIAVIAVLDEGDVRRLGALLGPDFYFSEEAALDAVARWDSFNVIDRRSFLKVDVFLPRPGPLGQDQLARRRELTLAGGVTVPVLGPEDIILQKLRWYRIGGGLSERQWRDLTSVLGSGDLDDAYLDRIADLTGLADLLLRARAET